MRIKFVKVFPVHEKKIEVGEEYDVIMKKDPDKFRGYTEYQIEVSIDNTQPRRINVPEMFVREIA